jgi:NitT/TauT family transport system permease protein
VTASRLAPKITGALTVVAFLAVLEAVIRLGWLNRYIVPPPSEVMSSFYRVITEEHVVTRFFFTAAECLATGIMLTVFGILGGVILQRYELLRQATETWVAALAAAPVVLAYPLFMVIFGRNSLTIIMIGFVAALPPVILKTIEGIAGR